MSDDYVYLIPVDPQLIPNVDRQEAAKRQFSELAPQADRISVEVYEHIHFFDCGENFERVCCPVCRADVTAWWATRIQDFWDKESKFDEHDIPCCQTKLTLPELIYEPPQGFGRFAVVAMNPNIGLLNDKHRYVFQQILATPLRVIRQRI